MRKNLKNLLTDKNSRRRILPALGAIVLIAAVLLPLFLPGGGYAQARESVHSVEAEIGTIAATVTATGNLQTVNAETIRIPTGLTVDEVFVSPGDIVSAGDALATFDLGSVQTRLAEVQEEIAELDREIEGSRNDTEPTRITAGVSGRVKAIFAEVGDAVASTVLTYESLMLLSVDGRMAVDIETDALQAGDTVTVRLSDGTELAGDAVPSIPRGTVTITLTDNGPRLGEEVTILQEDTVIGTGVLRINQPLAITGTSGNIYRVHVEENAQVSAGATLFTLEDVDTAPAHLALIAERNEQAEVLRTLLGLMQSGTLTANFEGIVEAVFIGDGASSGTSQMPSIPAGIPGGAIPGFMRGTVDGEPMNLMRLSQVEEIELEIPEMPEIPEVPEIPEAPEPPETPEPPQPPIPPEFQTIDSLESLNLAPPIMGASPQTSVGGQNFTGTVQWMPATPIFLPATTYQALVNLTANEGFLFGSGVLAELEAGRFPTEGATVTGAQMAGNALQITLFFPPTGGLPEGMIPGFPEMPEFPGLPGMPAFPAFPSFPSIGGFSMPSMPNMDASAMMGAAGASSNIQTSAFTIAAGEEMQLIVSVDERDILSLAVGQSAEITLEAAVGEVFTGAITRINASGTTGGGAARYQVEITLPRTEHMLPGMSASAVVTTYEVSGILILPAEAIQEDWPLVYVYTALVNGEPAEPVEVQTGLSDGLYVEVISGLSPGDTVYYIVIQTQGWPMWGMGGGWGN